MQCLVFLLSCTFFDVILVLMVVVKMIIERIAVMDDRNAFYFASNCSDTE